MPMLPPPPPRFSTKNEPPSDSCSAAAMMRAMMSDGPPGVLATRIFTGRSGKAASADETRSTAGAATPAASAPAVCRTRRRDGFPDHVVMTSSRKILLRIQNRPRGPVCPSTGQPSTQMRRLGKSMLMGRLGKGGLLLGRGFLLVLGPPFVVRHAVDGGAALVLAHGQALGVGRLLHPVGQPVSAEAGETHQVVVLHVGAPAQVLDQPSEHGGFELGAGLVVEIHDRFLFAPPPGR